MRRFGGETLWHPSPVTPDLPAPSRPVVLGLAAAFFAAGLAQAGLFAARVSPGLLPDERAHVSYVRDAAARSSFVPRFEAMRLLDADGSFGREPNYLPHPPLTYRAAAALERLSGEERTPGLVGAIRSLRRASLPLFAAALAAVLAALLPAASTSGGAAFLGAALLAVPMASALGASPNPDTVALLGGGLAAAGALRVAARGPGSASGLLLGGGTALAALAKLTGALLCGFLLALLLLALLSGRLGGARRPSRAFFAAVLLPLLLPAAYWLAVVARYGTPVPSLAATSPRAFAASPWGKASPPDAPRMSPGAWAARSLRVLDFGTRSFASHVAVPASGPASLALRLVPLAALAGLLLPARGEADAGRRVVLLAAAAAGLAVLAIHLVATYRDHLRTGGVFGVQARYYFPLLPLALVAALRAVERIPVVPLRRAATWGGALLLLAGEAALLRAGASAGAW